MTPAKKTQTPEPVADAIVTPATPTELIKGLIQALGHDPAKVAGLDISGKHVRVMGKDRSMRSHTVGVSWSADIEAGVTDE